MSLLTPFCQQLKQQYIPKQRSTTHPVRCWSETDRHHTSIVDAFVIILRTTGCSWSHTDGCSMCGYFTDSAPDSLTTKDIETQVHQAMQRYHGEPVLKIFTSGSFFDTKEISRSLQQKILSLCATQAKKIVFESRPEYITKASIDLLTPFLKKTEIEVGIGLETANDLIREHAINKGFSYDDYLTAATSLQNNNIGVKTYVFVKPLFLTEKDAINDALNTVETVKNISTTISFNPANIQRHTVMEYFWRRQYYRPPWLWSILEILSESKQKTTTRLQCDIVGGGSHRGAHNCPACDKEILEKIRTLSLTQHTDKISSLSCNCKKIWTAQCNTEKLTFGSIIDYQQGYQ
ncbi:MAG: archaeosine biosynthesis radical SAM protein RaSEA [Candidatus Thermoplasmatota archaeon]|nr:archaeosine biosynthesis radical SAM protein RaSEA [Candidatus Thermoplasmatota archaeon]MBU1941693.1 archaeosine biosynthesis radical SAM protein RaSEA [Candidatus Thermoplasmatota archaeon]